MASVIQGWIGSHSRSRCKKWRTSRWVGAINRYQFHLPRDPPLRKEELTPISSPISFRFSARYPIRAVAYWVELYKKRRQVAALQNAVLKRPGLLQPRSAAAANTPPA